MLKRMLSKIKKNPLELLKRALYKTTVGPMKYKKGDDYDAESYWHDRFSKYGKTLKGAGDEGLSEDENRRMYVEAAEIFTDICRKQSINFENADVLEVGVGTGFYTKLLHDLGVKKYTGVDITDLFFKQHRQDFPQYRFIKKDITADKIEGKFDLIIMIDVIEHIVSKTKLAFCMDNIKGCLSEKGIFIVAPVMDTSKKHLFYLSSHSLEDIKKMFSGYIFEAAVPFRDGDMLVIKRAEQG